MTGRCWWAVKGVDITGHAVWSVRIRADTRRAAKRRAERKYLGLLPIAYRVLARQIPGGKWV